MTFQQPPQYPPMQAPPEEKFRGLAWAGLILGIIGICGSILPIVNNLTAVAAFVGLVLAVIALFGTKKVVAAIGAALCVLAIVVTVALQGLMLEAIDETLEEAGTGGGAPAAPPPAEQDASGTVRYEVSGSGEAMNISFGAGGSMAQETSPALPWSKEQPASDGFDTYSLTAQNGSDDAEITCRLTVNGEVVVENTSAGPYAVVSCTGTSGL